MLVLTHRYSTIFTKKFILFYVFNVYNPLHSTTHHPYPSYHQLHHLANILCIFPIFRFIRFRNLRCSIRGSSIKECLGHSIRFVYEKWLYEIQLDAFGVVSFLNPFPFYYYSKWWKKDTLIFFCLSSFHIQMNCIKWLFHLNNSYFSFKTKNFNYFLLHWEWNFFFGCVLRMNENVSKYLFRQIPNFIKFNSLHSLISSSGVQKLHFNLKKQTLYIMTWSKPAHTYNTHI